MTKEEQNILLKRVATLEKQVSRLYEMIHNNKLDRYTYTVAETAALLNVTPQAVYAMIDRRELETIKLGHIKVLGSSLREKFGIEV